MSTEERPVRLCSGGPHAVKWCGKVATVVCTERDEVTPRVKWFACEDVEHREGALIEPIDEWFRRLFPGRS